MSDLEKIQDDGENVDPLTAQITEQMEKSVLPLVQDVADWLSKYLRIKIDKDNFLDMLDDGLFICKLAEKIQIHSENYVKMKSKGSVGTKFKVKPLPKLDFQCHNNVKRQSFFARDNAAKFIQWCKNIGMKDTILFESEGLVLQKQLKHVVLTLLELGRIASKYELDLIPSIVKIENEIDEEERATDPKQNITVRRRKNSKIADLDSKVQKCALRHEVKVEKIKEGKYIVNGKTTVFVRLLHDHMMVRVGGGWDEFEHFLSRHKPEKIGKILISTTAACRGC